VESARLLLAGLPPMVARFFADAATVHSSAAVAVARSTMKDLAAEIEQAGADIVVVSLSPEAAATLSARLFRTTSVRVVVGLSVSGDRADLYSRGAPPRQAASLDAAELLNHAVSLALSRERRSRGRS